MEPSTKISTELSTLGQTLDCGQCFRWSEAPDGSWRGVARGKYLHITEENLPKVLENPFWAEYFDAGLDYGKIRAELSALDPRLAEAARFAPEIRILRQEPWEALCSFLISQCNNIKRIKGIIARLCQAHGEPCAAYGEPCAAYGEPCGEGAFTFPAPEKIAVLEEGSLRKLGCGYRAGYLIDAARKVESGAIDFRVIQELPLPEAQAELRKIEGVGPKVADCALLYGLHRLDAFPADVWIKRAMGKLFPGRTPAYFGAFAGVAQQYLFHYSRNHPELFQTP